MTDEMSREEEGSYTFLLGCAAQALLDAASASRDAVDHLRAAMRLHDTLRGAEALEAAEEASEATRRATSLTVWDLAPRGVAEFVWGNER